MLRRLIAAAIFLLTASAALAAEEKTVVYAGATVIDTATGVAHAHMAIVTKGENIVAVVPDDRTPRHATIVDAHGLFAIPGLIESHVHYASPPIVRLAHASLRRDVYSGITAIRDMAGDTRALSEFAREARFGEIPAPDIYYAALFAGPEFFSDPRTADAARGATPGKVPWMRAIAANTDIRLAVANAVGTGATAIKIYADLPADRVRAITAEAHKQGLLVWAHASVFPASPADVIGAGVDVVSHSCLLAYAASPAMPPAYHDRAPVDAAKFANGIDPSVERLFADMKAHGTILDATNYVYEIVDKANAGHPGSRPSYCSAAIAEKITRAAYDAGVPISIGTDAPAPWQQPYPAFQDEADIMARIGIPPAVILRSATIVGAITIGHTRDMGTLEAGKLANIVFLARNPLDDIAALRTVVFTVKRGHVYRRADYQPITADEARDE